MINFECVKIYCNEDISLIENYDKAISDSNKMWHCHHRRENISSRKQLIENNEYYNRPASELIFLTHSEHTSLHSKGNKYMLGKHRSEETKLKISVANKGKIRSEEARSKMSIALKGKHMSEEHKQKISVANKGKKRKPFSEESKRKISAVMKGNKNRLGKHHSEETKRKMSAAHKFGHWFNNGLISVRARECPEGFVK